MTPPSHRPVAVVVVRYGMVLISVWGIVREGHAEKLVQVGIASYYGKAHHGRVTANGEIYNMWGYTTAHPTLPFHTLIRVTRVDLTPPRSVIVRVNDRGPIHPHRVLDLSFMAACRLKMSRCGIAPVTIEVLGMSPRQTARRR